MSELKAIRSGEIYDIIEYEDCYRTDDLYYPKSEADKVIAELKDENAELKDEIKRLENVRKVHIEGIESMSEGLKLDAKQICKTQRALWLARKAHAVAMFAYWDAHYRDNPNAVYRNRTVDWLRNRWLLILDCCIKKEKEYK